MKNVFCFLVGLGCGILLYFAIVGTAAKPSTSECECSQQGSLANGVMPIADLPDDAAEVKPLGNGWVIFRCDLAGYRRVFVYRRGAGVAELSHLSQYIGGKGGTPEKPGRVGQAPDLGGD